MIKYTELKSTHRHNLIDVLPLKKPYTVLIEPSNLCNFKCIQCFQSLTGDNYFTRNRMNMPFSLFNQVINQLKLWKGDKIKVLKLSLYGEPLINPDFCEMLHIAKKADVAERIETTTNASLLTRSIAENLVESQIDYMRVSIYASSQERHEKVTGSGLNIRVIHENLRVLQEVKKSQGSERPFISVKMIDSYNEENDQFVRMYQDVADELYIDKPHGWINVDNINFIEKYYQDSANEVITDLERNSTARVACPMAFTTMAVRSNGDISPCCVDFIGGTNICNIIARNVQDIWKSDSWCEFQKMQLQNRKFENYSCARCDIYRNDHYTRDNIDGFPVDKLR